jgi:hypothetical protein
VPAHVRASERDGCLVDICRPDLHLWQRGRDRDRDGARAGADVDDASCAFAEMGDRRVDELLTRRPRRHHATGDDRERQRTKGNFIHTRLCVARAGVLTWLEHLLAADERAQAFMLLAAGRAAVEVRGQGGAAASALASSSPT